MICNNDREGNQTSYISYISVPNYQKIIREFLSTAKSYHYEEKKDNQESKIMWGGIFFFFP